MHAYMIIDINIACMHAVAVKWDIFTGEKFRETSVSAIEETFTQQKFTKLFVNLSIYTYK